MRKTWISAVLFAALAVVNPAWAGGPQQMATNGMGGDNCDPCDPCNDGGGRNRRNNRRNQEAGFNCGCNGSYKYPVPPLYTYHWPGMYSAQLMTDYHSPWRFPPLKPYVDEIPPEVVVTPNSLRRVQPAAAVSEAPRFGQATSFSSHVQQSLR
jgi:hypothetical protein